MRPDQQTPGALYRGVGRLIGALEICAAEKRQRHSPYYSGSIGAAQHVEKVEKIAVQIIPDLGLCAWLAHQDRSCSAEWLDIDSQGRILISKRHLQTIAIESNEVLFVGMSDRFAVWSKARYEQTKMPQADFAKRLRERMMKQSSGL